MSQFDQEWDDMLACQQRVLQSEKRVRISKIVALVGFVVLSFSLAYLALRP